MVTNSHAISDIDSSLDAWAPTHWEWLYDTVLPQGCSIDISSAVGAQTCNPPMTVAKTKLTHSDCICQKLCFVKFMLLYCCLTVFSPPHILKKGVICRIFRNFLMCSQNILPKYVQKPNLKCIKQIWNSSNPSKNGPKLINITKIIIIIQQIIKNPSTHQPIKKPIKNPGLQIAAALLRTPGERHLQMPQVAPRRVAAELHGAADAAHLLPKWAKGRYFTSDFMMI